MPERKISPPNAIQLPHRYIPNDAVLSILSKLSLKSFKRFQSICKSWSLLFDDPFCMNLYRKSFLFENVVLLELPNPYRGSTFEILGSASVNGILCLCIHNNEFKKLLSSPRPNYIPLGCEGGSYVPRFYNHHLVGYDCAKANYKVVQIAFYTSSYPHVSYWEIYNLSSNSWKKMDDHIPPFYTDYNPVYIDGMSHWWNGVKTNSFLISFDFSTESFIMTPMPSYVHDLLADIYTCKIQLMILKGSIALTLHHKETSTFYMHFNIG
ncbi:F-box/LRR-repeat/kelch-repeat protein At2g27520-like [Vicia villosa]|uniref:F-box/LRR-repeat/kelch-repeat protein At2g27520-like n=1 Tax=Vicia villosa TaxID=3911 RepID=UPI00273B33C6|nr:F-box/LRR-repeat/kelch-repeat protein At2g27520-like [Vicia villosa]